MPLEQDYEVCRALARSADRDRYLSALFAPAERRRHLFALAAFNAEVARIRDHVSEPMLGEVRLQWWRDAIDGHAAGDVSLSPIAHALVDTIHQCDLPPAVFHDLIDARAFDFYTEPMATLGQFETYLDATSTSLIALGVRILSDENVSEIAKASVHAGRAYAITGLLRSFAMNASRGRIYLPPLDVLARHGASEADATSGTAKPELRAALREMRDLARFHRMEAQRALAAAPKAALPAFLPLALVPRYLDRMEWPDYDPFHTPVEIPQWQRPWLLWRAARK